MHGPGKQRLPFPNLKQKTAHASCAADSFLLLGRDAHEIYSSAIYSARMASAHGLDC